MAKTKDGYMAGSGPPWELDPGIVKQILEKMLGVQRELHIKNSSTPVQCATPEYPGCKVCVELTEIKAMFSRLRC